jgi:hypothetical protein
MVIFNNICKMLQKDLSVYPFKITIYSAVLKYLRNLKALILLYAIMRYNSVKDAKQQTTQLISGKEEGKDVICRVIESIDPTGQCSKNRALDNL